MAGLLVGAAITHFAAPKFYDQMVPTQLPGAPRQWTYGSGVIELGVGALVAAPRSRRLGALAAAALFVAVFPANVKMAADAHRRDRPAPAKAALVARLPLQAPLVVWALRVARRS
nr:MauE/DoxX family redox-associated membrane protein [Jatrophihabitans sp. GAS493]